MAVATIEQYVQNPGRKAGKMTAKQIKYFGTKRQRAALKHKRKSSASHRPRTKKRNPAKRKHATHRKSSARKRSTPRKRNLGGLYVLTANPAKGRTMARTKKRKSSKVHHRNAGSRKTNPGRRHHRRRSNPGQYGSPVTWLSGGAGVIIGVTGARGLPQMLLGANNTGAVGYAANAAATGILAFLAHMAMPRNPALVGGIIAGGAGATLSRIISDYSLLGSYSSKVALSSGMGDYVFNWNYATPQQISTDQRGLVPPGGYPPPAPLPVNVQGAGVSGLYGGSLY